MAFKMEDDNWWWEELRLDEIGLPAAWNPVIPDKLFHFLIVFGLTWGLSKARLSRTAAALIAWGLMMGPWELLWDGCFRYGASWKDMVANTLGALVCWWWLGKREIVGQASQRK